MAEIEVGFCPIVCYENLSVLIGRHGSWIDVDVGIELHQGDREASGFENGTD